MKLPYGEDQIYAPWNPVLSFFDEAIRCFFQGTHKGCLTLCRATLEAVLEERSGIRGTDLTTLIDKCRGKQLPEEFFKDAKFIESWGNPYSHADTGSWEAVNGALKTTFVETPFEPTVADEKIALECLLKLRNIVFTIYKK